MGADLVLHMLEMPKEKEPNWKAAKAHLTQLSDVRVCELATTYPYPDDEDEYEDDDDESAEGNEDGEAHDTDKSDGDGDGDGDRAPDEDSEISEVTDSRRRLRQALAIVRSCWDEERRNAVRLKGVNTAIMVVGGTSFGDPFSEINDVDLFIVSGMAEAAGFILP